jgi:DNA-directed RNA polymerase subunit beta'
LQHNLGEPGTQLTCTFHVGGVGGISEESSIITKFKGKLEIEDIKLLKGDNDGNAVDIVVSRSTELKLVDEKTGILLNT